MENNDILAAEIATENQRREQEKQKPVRISRGQVSTAKFVWTIGAVAIDAATAYLVWQITYWWYGIIWLVAGAGGLVYSEYLRERVGNNLDQRNISDLGVKVSGLSIVVMALLAGVVYILGYTKVAGIEIAVLVFVVSLFFYHLFQSYQFHVKDDEYIEQTDEARSEEENNRGIRQIHRAARRVEAKKKQGNWKEYYRGQHGRAIDAALGLYALETKMGMDINQDGHVGKPPQARTSVQPNSTQNSTRNNAPKQPNTMEYTLPQLLKAVGKNEEEFASFLTETKTLSKAWQVLRDDGLLPDGITHRNFNELCGRVSPNGRGPKNGHTATR